MTILFSTLFAKILELSYAAAWLVLVVILLRLALKKAPKYIICILWAFVALRLICPVTVESSLCLIPGSNALSELLSSAMVGGAETASAPAQVSTPQQTSGITDTPNLQEHGLDNHSVLPETGQTMQEKPIGNLPAPNVQPDKSTPSAKTVLSGAIRVLGLLWPVGCACMFAFAAFSYLRLRKNLGTSVKLRGRIYECDGIDTPFVSGILRPRIYLPSSLPSTQADYVTAHELAHLKRCDHIWKPLGYLLLSIYWFHPLIWAAYILFCRDIELACDEKVVKGMDLENKKSYAKALLSCSVRQKALTACPLAFGEIGVKQRIKSILNYKKPAFWAVIASALACVIVAVCFLTSPKTKASSSPETLETGVETTSDTASLPAHKISFGSNLYESVPDNDAYIDEMQARISALLVEKKLAEDQLAELNMRIDELSAQSEDGEINRRALSEAIESRNATEVWSAELDSMLEESQAALEQAQLHPVDQQSGSQIGKAMTYGSTLQTGTSGLTRESVYSMVQKWADAFVSRDGKTIAALSSTEVQEKLAAAELLEELDGQYVFGLSSPWPMEYLIYDYTDSSAEIFYYALTSEPHVTCWKESLTFRQTKDGGCEVAEETLQYFDNISSGSEFNEAYDMGFYITATGMDYTCNGLGEALNNTALISSSTLYLDLFEPESAARSLLNLSRDESLVKIKKIEEMNGIACLEIDFTKDGITKNVLMRQPYGEIGIWVPQTYNVDELAFSRLVKTDPETLKKIPYHPGELNFSRIICLGEIPEKNIRVYGYGDEETGGRGIAVDIGGTIGYYDWYYISPRAILPKLYWDEEKQQLQISCLIYTGTGVSAEQLYIVQKNESGNLQGYMCDMDFLWENASDRIGYTYDKEKKTLTLYDTKPADKLVTEPIGEALEYYSDNADIDQLEFGSFSEFRLGKDLRLCVRPGYHITGNENTWMCQYENMPYLEFKLIQEMLPDGTMEFRLGDLADIVIE